MRMNDKLMAIRRRVFVWANPRTSRMALVSLLIWGMTSNLGASLYASTSTLPGTTSGRTEAADWVASGRDEQGDPWLRTRQGITGHFRALSNREMRIEISRPTSVANRTAGRRLVDQPIGWVEVGSVAGEEGLFVKWSPEGGQDLTIRTTRHKAGGQRVEIGYHSQNAVLFVDPKGVAQTRPTNEILEGADQLLAEAAAQPALQQLVKEASPFLSREALSLLPPLPAAAVGGGVSDCVSHITDCLVILVAYGAGMGSLLGSCGFTFGWGCAGALVAHPILAGASAIYCGRAGHTCSQ
jgi:hypothetical protein